MRNTLAVLVCAFVPFISAASQFSWSNDSSVRDYYSDLLKRGGFGFLPTEAAAFLVQDPNGRYRCIAWPYSTRQHSQGYIGRLPQSLVAIVHTHPKDMTSLPSQSDQSTAKQFGVPVIVLTPRAIYAATPDGSTLVIVRDAEWYAPAALATRCEVPAAVDGRGERPEQGFARSILPRSVGSSEAQKRAKQAYPRDGWTMRRD